ncbi:MAG: thioredoxin domain-containing protein [Bacillaceae bacterium]|nr:thioredoxin domain-containing protein [Bacillaceae bacterium]
MKDRYSDRYNWLVKSQSPYLQQHQTNPVNWLEWSEEAFQKARQENKPVFLSIGYSTCHWCHVMAHESFEDEKVAELLNDRFISIKVDREERPDIDSVYMRVCQLLTGQGGWPLSVFLTPDKKPFYAGTYFPKTSRYNMPGFVDVITQLYDKYQKSPDKIADVSDKIINNLKPSAGVSQESLGKEHLVKTYKRLARSFDSKYGGFTGAPKFPTPHNLMFLMRYHIWNQDENDALNIVEKTLDAMADGGIYDHIGYGFARYSTDGKWLVPHFEKMLYDNALLLSAYTEAYQLTGKQRFREISEQIIEFVRREMTSDEGAFYSAIDADSEGIEGKYYVWELEEIISTLGTEDGELFAEAYDISNTGNFEGKNVPNVIDRDFDQLAEYHNLTADQLKQKLNKAKEKLFQKRKERTYPHIDDKILTSWNAMMIAGLAQAGRVYGNPDYAAMAREAMDFIEKRLIVDGRVMVRYRDGEVKNKGFIDDYAYLIRAYLELYETTFDIRYLQKGKEMTRSMLELFWDGENGGFYFTAHDAEELIVREKETYDGAIPSGNSVAAEQLIRLARLTGEMDFEKKAEEMFRAFKDQVEGYETGHTYFMLSVMLMEMPSKEIVIIGDEKEKGKQKLIRHLQEKFSPQYAILSIDQPDAAAAVAPFTAGYGKKEGKTTVYVCENFACQQPTNNIDEVITQL